MIPHLLTAGSTFENDLIFNVGTVRFNDHIIHSILRSGICASTADAMKGRRAVARVKMELLATR
jgi:hypothetical protein